MNEIRLHPQFEIAQKQITVSEPLFTEIWDLLPEFIIDKKSLEFLAMIIEKSSIGFSE